MAQLSNIAVMMAMLTMTVMMSMTKVMMAIFKDKFVMIVVLIKDWCLYPCCTFSHLMKQTFEFW